MTIKIMWQIQETNNNYKKINKMKTWIKMKKRKIKKNHKQLKREKEKIEKNK